MRRWQLSVLVGLAVAVGLWLASSLRPASPTCSLREGIHPDDASLQVRGPAEAAPAGVDPLPTIIPELSDPRPPVRPVPTVALPPDPPEERIFGCDGRAHEPGDAIPKCGRG